MRLQSLMLVSMLILPPVVRAQHPAGRAAPTVTAPREAAQFDFLIGQWELIVTPKVSGLAARIHGAPRLLGIWKAWKAFDGFGIEDELRIVDGSGNPTSLSHALRVYNSAERKWSISGLDVYRTRFATSTAEWKDGAMTSTSSGTNAEGKPMLIRSRFHAITPNSFRFQQDRSADDGRTWTEGILKIEAKRVAAAAPR